MTQPFPDLNMAGVAYQEFHAHPPFHLRATLAQHWLLYLVRDGDVLFEADDTAQTRQVLPAGSVVALSGVLRHGFSSRLEPSSTAVETRWLEQPLGTSSGGATVITVGSIAMSRMAFLAPFERIVLLSADIHPQAAARFARAIDWIAEEAGRGGPESAEIIRRVAEITTLEIGRFERAQTEAPDCSAPRATSDQRILRAVAAFYAAPEEKWSVERLAGAAGMSRTAFAVRYRQLIGTTPLRSLRQLRLQLSGARLVDGVAKAAAEAGYGSGTSFIRAYAREFGGTPGKQKGRQSFFEKDHKTFVR